MTLARNLERISRAAGPPIMVLSAALVILSLPFILMAIGAIELWASIRATFPRREKLNIDSGAKE